MSEKEKTKGPAQQLMDLEEQIGELIDVTTDPAQREELLDLQEKVAEQSRRLIRRNLDTSTREYELAAIGLENAAEATRQAIDEVDSVKAAIDLVAKALDLASKVVV